jgi:large subunit ribosomal protein L13
VATLAARLLQGKHKAIYTPFIDTGDHVVVINAASVKLTGAQGRPEDLPPAQRIRRRPARGARRRRPQAPAGRLVEEAVRGMLPKTKMGDAMYRKLKVYAGADHPHAAQQPRESRSRNTWPASNTTPTGPARRPRRGFLVPATAHQPSTTASSTSTSRRLLADDVRRPLTLTETDREVRHPRDSRRRRVNSHRGVRLGIASRARPNNCELAQAVEEDGLSRRDSRVKDARSTAWLAPAKRSCSAKR